MDTNQNGTLSAQEIIDFLRANGDNDTPIEMIQLVIDVADQNADGELSW